jgi:hypothetical protein
MLQDIEAGRAVELDALVAAVQELGALVVFQPPTPTPCWVWPGFRRGARAVLSLCATSASRPCASAWSARMSRPPAKPDTSDTKHRRRNTPLIHRGHTLAPCAPLCGQRTTAALEPKKAYRGPKHGPSLDR